MEPRQRSPIPQAITGSEVDASRTKPLPLSLTLCPRQWEKRLLGAWVANLGGKSVSRHLDPHSRENILFEERSQIKGKQKQKSR